MMQACNSTLGTLRQEEPLFKVSLGLHRENQVCQGHRARLHLGKTTTERTQKICQMRKKKKKTTVKVSVSYTNSS